MSVDGVPNGSTENLMTNNEENIGDDLSEPVLDLIVSQMKDMKKL